MTNELATILNIDKSKVLNTLAEWNKQKFYPVDMIKIDITKDGVQTNALQIKEVVDKVLEVGKDSIKNNLDADTLERDKTAVKTILTSFTGARKIVTSSLDNAKKEFIQNEKDMTVLIDNFTDKIKEIKEVEFQKNEDHIKHQFQLVFEEQNLKDFLHLDMFKDFISKKRENKIFTTKGALTKKIMDDINEVVRIAYEPIKKQLDLEHTKVQESKQFISYMENIETVGSITKLEAAIITLNRYKEQIPTLYPNTTDENIRHLDNKIQICEANIRAEEAKKVAEDTKGADDELLAEVEQIKQVDKTDVMALGKARNRLKEIYTQLKFAVNIEAVTKLGGEINNYIKQLEVVVVTPIVDVPFVDISTELPTNTPTKWYVADEDLLSLAKEGITANTEEEARKELKELFLFSLDFMTFKEK